jgi:hypothetical protein
MRLNASINEENSSPTRLTRRIEVAGTDFAGGRSQHLHRPVMRFAR